jgi:hypothetical protein
MYQIGILLKIRFTILVYDFFEEDTGRHCKKELKTR